MNILFVTGNKGKIEEAAHILSRWGIGVYQSTNLHKVEIQSNELEEIVTYALNQLCDYGDLIAVEDDGLFIDSLHGFPGPYSAYVYATIGLRGILQLLESTTSRRAVFRSIVGVCMGGKPKLFRGEVVGNIVNEPRGSHGFGFDPIFAPLGVDSTFAEMNIEEKSIYSHRSRAFTRLAEYLVGGR
jgi:XTP/dITP diphosphohydrolase